MKVLTVNLLLLLYVSTSYCEYCSFELNNSRYTNVSELELNCVLPTFPCSWKRRGSYVSITGRYSYVNHSINCSLLITDLSSIDFELWTCSEMAGKTPSHNTKQCNITVIEDGNSSKYENITVISSFKIILLVFTVLFGVIFITLIVASCYSIVACLRQTNGSNSDKKVDYAVIQSADEMYDDVETSETSKNWIHMSELQKGKHKKPEINSVTRLSSPPVAAINGSSSHLQSPDSGIHEYNYIDNDQHFPNNLSNAAVEISSRFQTPVKPERAKHRNASFDDCFSRERQPTNYRLNQTFNNLPAKRNWYKNRPLPKPPLPLPSTDDVDTSLNSLNSTTSSHISIKQILLDNNCNSLYDDILPSNSNET